MSNVYDYDDYEYGYADDNPDHLLKNDEENFAKHNREDRDPTPFFVAGILVLGAIFFFVQAVFVVADLANVDKEFLLGLCGVGAAIVGYAWFVSNHEDRKSKKNEK